MLTSIRRLRHGLRPLATRATRLGGVSRDEVIRGYRLLFGREPENDAVIAEHQAAHSDAWSFMASLLHSKEFATRAAATRVPRATFDWESLLARYQQRGLDARPGYVTDFLGIHTNLPFLNDQQRSEGFIEGLPTAGGFHCSAAEWAAALRGVELADDDFVCVELGAGWGAWMAALCRAAQIQGAWRTRAIGCEADALHCRMLHEHLKVNGFEEREYRLFEGAVGPTTGIALFPVSEDSANDWGMRPVFCASDSEADQYVADPQPDYRGFTFRQWHRVPCFSLADILAEAKHVDVMHVDIQGGEADLVEQNLELLCQRVAYLAIGTHSRPIEGQLITTLKAAGWKLEVEETCSFDMSEDHFQPLVDGMQGWRNIRLRP